MDGCLAFSLVPPGSNPGGDPCRTTMTHSHINHINLIPRNKKPLKETDFGVRAKHNYIIDGKILFVWSNVFEFKSYYKPRWGDRKIFDVLLDEFRHATRDYWKEEFTNGRILCKVKVIETEGLYHLERRDVVDSSSS